MRVFEVFTKSEWGEAGTNTNMGGAKNARHLQLAGGYTHWKTASCLPDFLGILLDIHVDEKGHLLLCALRIYFYVNSISRNYNRLSTL